MANLINVLQPQYVRHFQCIASDCEDSCCKEWNIHVDKETYQLYEYSSDKELRQNAIRHIIRNHNSTSDSNYAMIKMDENSWCPFFDENKLCSIQRGRGEIYLSVVCSLYPRIYNLSDILEKSIDLSCPEAARAALLNPAPMEFELTQEDERQRKLFTCVLPNSEVNPKNRAVRYFHELRSFSIDLLQNRNYPVWQRLIILGLFSSKLDQLISESKSDDILALTATYRQEINSLNYLETLKNVPAKQNIQLKLIGSIISCKTELWKCGSLKDFFGQTLQGIYDQESSEEKLQKKYTQAYANYYQPFIDQYSHILEHYLVNYCFATLFPLSNGKTVFENYTVFIIHYAVIKMLLIGSAGLHKKEFGVVHALQIIQAVTRLFTHDQAFLESLNDFLRDNSFDNMHSMAVLIKN